MDGLALVYYALVCALLAHFAPRLRGRGTRFMIGALVGVIAALALPQVRALI